MPKSLRLENEPASEPLLISVQQRGWSSVALDVHKTRLSTSRGQRRYVDAPAERLVSVNASKERLYPLDVDSYQSVTAPRITH